MEKLKSFIESEIIAEAIFPKRTTALDIRLKHKVRSNRAWKIACTLVSLYVSWTQKLFDVNEKTCMQSLSQLKLFPSLKTICTASPKRFLQYKIKVCSLNPPYFFKCCTISDCLDHEWKLLANLSKIKY